MTLAELIADSAQQLSQAGVQFGQGTLNATDEAAWLVLWQLGLPLDTAVMKPLRSCPLKMFLRHAH